MFNTISNQVLYTLALYDIWNMLDNQQKETLTEAINIGIDEGIKQVKAKPEIVEDYGKTFERIGEYAVKLRFCGNTDRITIEELYQRFKYRILLEEFNR